MQSKWNGALTWLSDEPMNHRDFATDYFYSENQIENKTTQMKTHKSLNVKRDYFDIFLLLIIFLFPGFREIWILFFCPCGIKMNEV